MKNKYVVWYEEVDKNDVGLVGGKGANLGEMIIAGFPIPYGFIVTSYTYFEIIKYNKIEFQLKNFLKNIDYQNQKDLHYASLNIKKLIKGCDIPNHITKLIIDYYQQLSLKENQYLKKHPIHKFTNHVATVFDPMLVAVRSSATAEDLPDASFAGQQETYLNVKGENHLITKIKDCWASLFTERAIYYRQNNKFDHFKVGLAAVIQRMVQSDQSGIAFTIDPVTNNKKVITIEAIFGLGEYIVQGKVTPDHYEISKHDFKILNKEIHFQNLKYIKKGTTNHEIKLNKKTGSKQKISDQQIIDLAKIVAKIEKHYFFPQDLEWAIEKGVIFITQSRPITTTKSDQKQGNQSLLINLKEILSGNPASPGIGSGKPIILHSPKEINAMKPDHILVATQTNPDYVPAMKKAAAIVTEVGGRTSHAAIVSRELGIPAVVGATNALKLIQKEKEITVDGSTGKVYQGFVFIPKKTNILEIPKEKVKTITKVYVNLAQVEKAKEIAAMDVDGVGLLRAEFIIADIGIHPKLIIKQKRQNEYIKILEKSLLQVVKPFYPRPVIYRATDFKTNEYRNLKGGKEYEPNEENPLIGFRGASRYIVWKDVFEMELEAISNIRKKGYKNLHLMIPFIRIPSELTDIKKIIFKYKHLVSTSFKLWIMVEVPSSVLLLDEFIKVGIDGVSVGTNDLTMLLLGVDRDNAEIAHIYDERNPAVLWALEKVVKTCNKNKITVSICGQAPSDFPEIVELLIKNGVTSISANPDAIYRVRQQAYLYESKLWQQLKK